MLKGYLTGLLSKETRDKGYSLTEDEDFLYVSLNNKVITVYSIHEGLTIQQIEANIGGLNGSN